MQVRGHYCLLKSFIFLRRHQVLEYRVPGTRSIPTAFRPLCSSEFVQPPYLFLAILTRSSTPSHSPLNTPNPSWPHYHHLLFLVRQLRLQPGHHITSHSPLPLLLPLFTLLLTPLLSPLTHLVVAIHHVPMQRPSGCAFSGAGVGDGAIRQVSFPGFGGSDGTGPPVEEGGRVDVARGRWARRRSQYAHKVAFLLGAATAGAARCDSKRPRCQMSEEGENLGGR
jgi:hypothetical protein